MRPVAGIPALSMAVLHMTVNGVAIATVISNAISSVLLFIKLRRTNGIIHLEAKELKIDSASLKNILRIGLPAGIQSAVFAVSNIVIQSAINSLGTVVMAASSAAYNIEIITYDILNSLPIENAIKPSATSLITAIESIVSFGIILSTLGPKTRPARRYPVTLGSLTSFTRRPNAIPEKIIIAR